MCIRFNYTLLTVLFAISIWPELAVSYPDCTVNEFACADETCIPLGKRCDNVRTCADGSDEVDCKGFLCDDFLWFMCNDKQCVADTLACNREYDCVDLSDERNCSNKVETSCPENQWLCREEGLCIPNLWVCNGIKECLNGEDEAICEKKPCLHGHRCTNGECIYNNWICDGVADCQDGSDEENCGNKTIPQLCTADRGLVLCADEKHCVRQEDVCNGIVDCPDKSDETLCSFDCNKRKCPESRKCIATTSRVGNESWCACPHGYRLVNGMECEDVNECLQYGNCDQLCTNTKGSYSCSCTDGYTLAMDNKSCEIIRGSPTLHFADGGSVKGLLTKPELTFIFKEHLVDAVGFTFNGDDMYYTETVEGHIRITKATYLGFKMQPFITMGLKSPEIITADPITGNVYFTDGGLKHIGVCTSDAKFCKVLITSGNDKPRGLALHFQRGEMFWSEWGEKPRIARAYMDGTNQVDFITTDVVWPSGIAVDAHVSIHRLYWADSQRKLIESVKLDGTDRRVIYKATLMHPYAVTVFESRVYWSDFTTRTLEACDKLNGNNHKIYVKYLHDTIYTVEAYHYHLHENLTNPCEDSPCVELCLLKFTDFSCGCSEGREADFRSFGCMGDVILGSQRLLIGTINELWILEYKTLGKPNIVRVPIIVENITAVALNIRSKSFLIADDTSKSIIQLDLMRNNFSMEIILTDKNIDHITSLDFDYLGNSVYWCDANKRTIELYNMLTKTRKVIATFTPGEKPVSIVIVPENGLIFCAVQKFRNISEIVILDLDGFNKIKIIRDGLVGPVRLTYDPLYERVFWADYATGTIESYSVNDKGRTIYKLSQASVSGIAALNSDIFWIKEHSNKLFWSNKTHELDNQNIKEYKIEEINKDQEIIHFISITLRATPFHICEQNNGNCSHLCIPTAGMSAKCSCPLGLKLELDGRTCFKPAVCTKQEFFCNSSNACIPSKLRCNHHKDCTFEEDEIGCNVTSYCPEEYFQCDNGDCINNTLVCDLNFDCRDLSDEINCETLYNQTCTIKEFMCWDKKCIPGTSVCNNVMDCKDGEDEKDCYTCPPNKFRCNVGTCIQKSWECDGEIDCRDGSDEHDGCAYKNCTLPNFLCNNELCISGNLRCNKIDDCGDFSDEVGCTKKDIARFCKSDEFICYKSKSLCLPNNVRCNGTFECPSFEDEEDCETCPFGDFRCNDGKCIPAMFVCDHYEDCKDQSDENYALCSHLYERKFPEIISCDNKYTCKNGYCIDYNLVCDGDLNCGDGSDENQQCDVSCENTTCSQLCERRPTGPTCLCREGYRLSRTDNQTCIEINECLHEPAVCAQKCSDTRGGYKCACFDGFQLNVDRVSCKSKGDDAPTIVFVAYDRIFTMSHKHQLEAVLFSQSLFAIADFDVSGPNHFMYYSVEDEMLIHRIHTDTKEHSYMNVTGRPQLISVDWVTENVYFVNESISSRSISVCNFDLRYCYTIRSIIDHSRITALKVDAVNKLLFFATVLMEFPTKSKVFKCFLDGSYVEEMHMSDTDYITGIAYDYNKKLLYLTEKNDGKILRMTYDGKNQTTILQNVPKATDITLFEDRLFFLVSNHVLQICPLYVRYHVCSNHTLHQGEISNFAINQSSVQPLLYNTCKDKNCTNLCVPTKGTVKCFCEPNKVQRCVNNLVITYSEAKFEVEDSSFNYVWLSIVVVVLVIGGLGYGIYRYAPQEMRLFLENSYQSGIQSVRYFVQREDTDGDIQLEQAT